MDAVGSGPRLVLDLKQILAEVPDADEYDTRLTGQLDAALADALPAFGACALTHFDGVEHGVVLSRVYAAQALSEAFQTSVEKAPRREVCPRAQIHRSQAGGAGRSSLAARGSHSSTGVATLSHQSSLNGESQRRSRKKIGNRHRAAGQVRHSRSQASRKLRRTKRVRTRPAAASRRTPARAAARTGPAPRPRATPS